ncbi:MAG: hypothetical protein ABR583_11870 [Gaiellaceae bacterium]
MRAAVIIIALLALTLAGAVTAAPGREPAPEDGGGCTICRFYDDRGFDFVTPSFPHDRCSAVLPNSQSVACSGWNGWDQARVWKNSGGSLRLGFWVNNPYSGFPEMWYRTYGPTYNGLLLTVERTAFEGEVPPYNAATCAYDFTYGGPSSYVLCEGVIGR